VASKLLGVREQVGEDLLTQFEREFQEREFGLEACWATGTLLEVGPAFVALEKEGIVGCGGGVVGEGCGGEVGGYVVVSAIVGACVHGGEVEKGWTAPMARGILGGMHLSGVLLCWKGGYV
jgi:hypothetical protein